MRVDLLRVDFMQSWSDKNWSRGSWSRESWSRVRQSTCRTSSVHVQWQTGIPTQNISSRDKFISDLLTLSDLRQVPRVAFLVVVWRQCVLQYFHCSNFYISAGKGLINKLTEQIVYLALTFYVCVIWYSINASFALFPPLSPAPSFWLIWFDSNKEGCGEATAYTKTTPLRVTKNTENNIICS